MSLKTEIKAPAKLFNKLGHDKDALRAVQEAVGEKSTLLLWQDYLSGERLDYKGSYEKNREKKKVNYIYKPRKGTLTITSRPANWHERGYKHESGKRVKGKHIFRDFTKQVEPRIDDWYDREIQKVLNKAGF